MKITEAIEVARPIDQVWALFQDVPELARCLPGADLTEDRGGGVYAGKVEAKLGPMTTRFEGEATVSSDEAAHTGSVVGKGADRQGGSMGQVKMQYGLEPTDGGTRINVDADITLSGAAAQFGRTGLIKEMSNRLIADFVKCLDAKLAAETPHLAAQVEAPELKGVSLFFSSLFATIGHFFKRLFGGGKDS